MKRIGTKITILICAALILLGSIVLVFCYTNFYRINQSSITELANIGMNVLRNDVEVEKTTVNTYASTLMSDSALITAISDKDADTISSKYKSLITSSYFFGYFTDAQGKEIWKTTNAPAVTLTDALDKRSTKNMYSNDGVTLYYEYKLPVISADQLVGTMTIGYDYSDISFLDSVKNQCYVDVTLFAGPTRISTTVINETGDRAVGTDASAKVIEAVLTNGQSYAMDTNLFGKNYTVLYYPIQNSAGENIGMYFAGQDKTSMENDFNTTILIVASVAIGLIIIFIIAAMILCKRMITKPLAGVQSLAEALADGNLSANRIKVKSKDEAGVLANKMNATCDSLNSYIMDIEKILGAMADGDYTVHSDIEYVGDFIAMKESMDKIGEGFAKIVREMNTVSDQVYSGTEQISSGAQLLAQGTTTQAATIQQLSSTVVSISDQVNLNAKNAVEAKTYSESVEEKVNEQNSKMEEMLNAMKDIEAKSNEIQRIIKAIDDIAFQTNILALNAAVEAARAGTAGKGFAVVAEEVRNLASKSADAASETNTLIAATMEAVQSGSEIATSAAESLKEVVAISRQTNNLIGGISDKTTEQATSLNEVTTGIEQISTVVQQNSATAEESSASCEELNGQAYMLKDMFGKFKV